MLHTCQACGFRYIHSIQEPLITAFVRTLQHANLAGITKGTSCQGASFPSFSRMPNESIISTQCQYDHSMIHNFQHCCCAIATLNVSGFHLQSNHCAVVANKIVSCFLVAAVIMVVARKTSTSGHFVHYLWHNFINLLQMPPPPRCQKFSVLHDKHLARSMKFIVACGLSHNDEILIATKTTHDCSRKVQHTINENNNKAGDSPTGSAVLGAMLLLRRLRRAGRACGRGEGPEQGMQRSSSTHRRGGWRGQAVRHDVATASTGRIARRAVRAAHPRTVRRRRAAVAAAGLRGAAVLAHTVHGQGAPRCHWTAVRQVAQWKPVAAIDGQAQRVRPLPWRVR